MKWFRNYVNQDTDPVISQIRAQLGLGGYARYYILISAVVEQMDSSSDSPSLALARRSWEQKLACKGKTFDSFLEQLQRIVEMKVTHSQNAIEVELPWLQKLLDKNAVSSANRRANGKPRVDKNRKDVEEIKQELNRDQIQTIKDQNEKIIDKRNLDSPSVNNLKSVQPNGGQRCSNGNASSGASEAQLLTKKVIASIREAINEFGLSDAQDHFEKQCGLYQEIVTNSLEEIFAIIQEYSGNQERFERFKREYSEIIEASDSY